VLQNPAPIISSITPSSILAGNPTPVILTGSGFLPGATVQVGNQSFSNLCSVTLTTGYCDSNLCSVSPTNASCGPISVPVVGVTTLTVTNPAPTVGASNAVSITGTAAGPGLSLTVVSVDPAGNTVATDGFGGAVSSTGRYYSFGGALPSPPANYFSSRGLVFLRDTCLGAPTNCVPSTVQHTTTNSIGESVGGVSADGRYVASVQDAVIVSPPAAVDLCTGAPAGCVPSTTRLTPAVLTEYVYRPYLIPNGRYMSYPSGGQADIFDTCAGAAPGCTITQNTETTQDADLFGPILSDDGRYFPYAGSGLAFQVLLHDSCLGAPPGCSPSDSPISTANCARPDVQGGTSISGDAQYLAYTCADGLKLQATCLNALPSCNPAPMQVDPSPAIVPPSEGPPRVSAGGRYVAYVPAAASINGQTLADAMIFVFDSCIGAGSGCTQKSVPLCLNSSGAVATGGCSLSGMTADGQYIVFSSPAANLGQTVPQDGSPAYIVKNPLF
jgi:hypothetical protein